VALASVTAAGAKVGPDFVTAFVPFSSEDDEPASQEDVEAAIVAELKKVPQFRQQLEAQGR